MKQMEQNNGVITIEIKDESLSLEAHNISCDDMITASGLLFRKAFVEMELADDKEKAEFFAYFIQYVGQVAFGDGYKMIVKGAINDKTKGEA